MKGVSQRLRGFYSASMLLLFAQNAAAALQFVFQGLTARALTEADFGLMNALFSLISFIVLPYTIYTAMLSRRWAELHNAGREEDVDGLWWSLLVMGCCGTLIILFAGWLLTPILQWWLKVPDPFLIRIALAVACFVMLLTAAVPFAIARQWFLLLAIGSIGGAILRLTVGWAGIQMDKTLFGALLATALLSSITFVLVVTKLKLSQWKELRFQSLLPERQEWLAPTLVATVTFILCGIDILVVRRFHDQQTSGEFAQVIILARIIYYFISPIAMVVFPKTATSLVDDVQKKETMVVRRAFFFGLGLLICVATVLYIFAPSAVSLLRGGSSIENSVLIGHLRLAVWCLVPISLTQLVVTSLFARRQERYLLEFTLLTLLLPLGLMVFNSSLKQAFLVEGAVGLILISFIVLRLLPARLRTPAS